MTSVLAGWLSWLSIVPHQKVQVVPGQGANPGWGFDFRLGFVGEAAQPSSLPLLLSKEKKRPQLSVKNVLTTTNLLRDVFKFLKKLLLNQN